MLLVKTICKLFCISRNLLVDLIKLRNEHFDYLYYDKKIEENNKEIVKSVKKDELLIFIENIDINEYNGDITIDILISCFKK